MYLLGSAAAAIGVVMYGRMLAARRVVLAQQRFALAIASSFAITVILLVVNENLHGIFLQYEYYAVDLWPFLALMLFSFEIDRGFTRTYIFVLLFIVACFVGVAIKQYEMPDWATDNQTVESVAIAVAAMVLLLGLQRNPRALLLGGYLLALTLSTLVVRTHQVGVIWEDPNSNKWRDRNVRLNTGLKFLAQAFTNSNVPHLHRPKFWADDDDVFDAIAYPRAYLWCGFQRFPKIDPERLKERYGVFNPGDVVVIVARPSDLFDRAKITLNGLNLEPKEITSKTIVDENGPYEILVVSIARRQPQ